MAFALWTFWFLLLTNMLLSYGYPSGYNTKTDVDFEGDIASAADQSKEEEIRTLLQGELFNSRQTTVLTQALLEKGNPLVANPLKQWVSRIKRKGGSRFSAQQVCCSLDLFCYNCRSKRSAQDSGLSRDPRMTATPNIVGEQADLEVRRNRPPAPRVATRHGDQLLQRVLARNPLYRNMFSSLGQNDHLENRLDSNSVNV